MSNLKIQKMTNKLPRKHNIFELKKKLTMQNGSGVLMFSSQKIEYESWKWQDHQGGVTGDFLQKKLWLIPFPKLCDKSHVNLFYHLKNIHRICVIE